VNAPALTRVTVFCGSNIGAKPEYVYAARGLGRLLAERKIGLVYGGSGIGTMRELASSARSRQRGGGVIRGCSWARGA
jgi:predicted Rossmann-fold nucleotide-binding protein